MLASHYSSSRASECSSSDNTLLTRDPIRIFKQINKGEGEKKKEFEELLGKLRENLPKGFKIGAAVGKGDCFFDSVAQGLNELKDKGLITNKGNFNVKSLREDCTKHANEYKDRIIGDAEKGGYFVALQGPHGPIWDPETKKDKINDEETFEKYSKDIKKTAQETECPIWGRPKIEGKMICKEYRVKIKVIELREEQVDRLNVTKDKVGTGNNIIYIVNYRNHFVPLLSKVEKDINKSIKVPREEAYGNVVGSSSNNISQSYVSTPLQDIENFSHKQGSHSRSPGKENRETSRKRGRSATDKNNKAPKRARMDVNVTSNEDSEFPSDLQDESRQDESHNAYQTNRCIPHHLIGLMYQLDLSVLCLLRESIYKHKYPSLSLAFEDSEIDKFSSIVLRYEKKSIHVQIENVDEYYMDNSISYTKLFTKEKRSFFFINNHFDSFVKHLISKLDNSFNNIGYLIIYTNSDLDLAKEKKLKKGQFRNFYPLKFDGINMEECDILRDFLFANNNTKGRGFYQFSQDKATREELLKRLEFSFAVQKSIKERKLSQEEMKEAFLDKLIFAVNQPNREELNGIIKDEIKKNSRVQYDYITLQKEVLSDLIAPGKLKNYIPKIIYEFNLLMLFLHDMFLHKNIFSINLEEKSYDTSNDITINYKDRTAYVKAHNADSNICYSQLFPSRKQKGKNTFSINKHFSLFVEELKNDMRYFIIYTNADLDLTEEKELKKVRSKGFYPLKFDSIDMEVCDMLKDFLFTNDNTQGCGFYQFSQDKTTREELLKRLEYSSAIQKVGKERKLSQEEMKEVFLDKLVFAINQPSREELNSIIESAVEKDNESNKVPYNYKELHEIALRWLESHEFGPITKEIMEKLLRDIKNNRSSYQKIQKNIDEETKFARSVVGREGTSSFYQFLNFLIKGEGRRYLEVLKRNEISLANMSSVLHGAGNEAVRAFKDLYNFWFDEEGNKMQYLKTLEKEGINLVSISSVLHGARASAAQAFKDLYDLWFDKKGNKTQYLTKPAEKGVDLVRMSSILSGAGANASRAFKDLYNLWFDQNGKKTQYLTKLEEKGVDLVRMSSILSGAGANASRAFKDLYDLWFDKKGNRTLCLKTLEKEGINLANMSSILHRAGNSAAQAFKDLYDLWFDKKGNKKQYLKILEKERVNLSTVSSILHGAGNSAAQAFKDLYDLWFDKQGNKKQCLKVLEENGINLANVSSILDGAGSNTARAFKDLYDLWFDKQGNKKQHLKHFTEKKDGGKSFTMYNLSSILGGAGSNTKDAFEKLHSVCFNDEGKRTELLDDFYKAGFTPSNLSCMLCKAGVRASSILKRLYNVCFSEKREKTKLLDDFDKIGFRSCDLCSILSGATDNLEKFHDFCFIGETKKYLNRFLDEKEGFTPSNLSQILHGARANICSALKDFHDICFDETGDRTKLLDDFYKVGFRMRDLSNILSMAGNNAASILRNFHKSCFNKENYLNHFLADGELFTPKNLSKILYGIGTKTCSTFEKLHDLCFDKAGNKTDYLGNLIKNNPPNKIFNILHKKVRKTPSTFLDNVSLQQQNVIELEDTDDSPETYLRVVTVNNQQGRLQSSRAIYS